MPDPYQQQPSHFPGPGAPPGAYQGPPGSFPQPPGVWWLSCCCEKFCNGTKLL